ncbi:glycosyltransferase family 117 protein [Aquimarina algicola]|uniref:DUF2723 domain-containing protein n=1 Tax=Aquimarina algicola TaxID=2589995 RepID=A0A504JA17_9FLAO|nr:DUF2723 domain-containing protein [Aquimarina algicola]TPN85435.1 DUF2723 domain-containing protein [Aquimarina algicola]
MITLSFKTWNRLLGWVVFTIALSVYILTVEPTNSFWDVGEYISTSSKLQIGHPPGAPLFQMIGAFASIFTTNKEQIAITLNITSGIASAFTILFLYWSIVLLVQKTKQYTLYTKQESIIIFASGIVGSLSFAFTDSFWFNAVEAEVYAMATCLLALLLYLGLLWQRDMHQPRGNRWLILISFVIGLSFGVHFMALLAIPAIGLLYYFKNYKKITITNFIVANCIAVFVLGFIFKLLVPYTLKFFSFSEIFFVNTFGLPFNSGTIIAGIVLALIFYKTLKYTRKKQYYTINTILLCKLFILIGFSSWIMLPIRANAGTVINEGNPNNARELLAYYNLEHYPKLPLLYGPQFTETYSGLDENKPYIDDIPKYEKDETSGKYIIVNDWKNTRQNLDNLHKAILPRMWSTEHITNYMSFINPIEFSIKPKFLEEQELYDAIIRFKREYANGRVDNEAYDAFLKTYGRYLDIKKPLFLDNITFLFQYQINYMYWRYFMWNFVGRQNDIQGNLDRLHGNWLSGISFIDEAHLGSQKNLSSDVKNNKARNTYYFLPLLLGILGLVFQCKKDKKSFWVVLVFFFFTGLALKIYLNEKPFEVRERDYALVGSFYAFSIWIGFGVSAIFYFLKKVMTPNIGYITTILCCTTVPTILAFQNWDDHDRSDRYTAKSMAKMYLSSCQENGILFTVGDNDTFAIWYAQEIEKYRTDVRTIISGYLSTGWYTDQMKVAAYESKPIPIQFPHKFYQYGNNDVIFHKPITKDSMLIANWLKWVASDHPKTKGELQNGKTVNTFPTKHVRIPVNKEKVVQNGIVALKDEDKIEPYLDLYIKDDYLFKHRLMMLDIIANTDWERPIYFSGGSYDDGDYAWLKEYLQLDGLVYKLVPIKTKTNPNNPYEMGRIDTERTYNIITNWEWGNNGNPKIYHDPQTRRNAISYRSSLGRLVEVLIKENKDDQAREILDLGMKNMPVEYFGYYTLLRSFIVGYYQIDEKEKARQIWNDVVKKYQEQLTYYGSLSLVDQYEYAEEIVTNIEYYRSMIDILISENDHNLKEIKIHEFNQYAKMFSRLYTTDDGN